MLTPTLFLLALIAQANSLKDFCAKNVTLKLHKSQSITNGVPYLKNVIDETSLSMHFLLPGDLNVKDIKFRLNDGPIDVDNDGRPPVHYLIEKSTGLTNVTLVIETPKQHYIGEWTMNLEKEDDSIISQQCFLLTPVLLHRFDETLRTSEGKELSAVCRAVGIFPPKKMQWYKVEFKEDGKFDLTKVYATDKVKSVEGDTLYFADARKSDSGVYICNATGDGDSTDSTVALVQIKSRLAALWPFIGILAELIILFITILVYERHKAVKAKKAAASDSLLSTKVDAAGDTDLSRSTQVKV